MRQVSKTLYPALTGLAVPPLRQLDTSRATLGFSATFKTLICLGMPLQSRLTVAPVCLHMLPPCPRDIRGAAGLYQFTGAAKPRAAGHGLRSKALGLATRVAASCSRPVPRLPLKIRLPNRGQHLARETAVPNGDDLNGLVRSSLVQSPLSTACETGCHSRRPLRPARARNAFIYRFRKQSTTCIEC